MLYWLVFGIKTAFTGIIKTKPLEPKPLAFIQQGFANGTAKYPLSVVVVPEKIGLAQHPELWGKTFHHGCGYLCHAHTPNLEEFHQLPFRAQLLVGIHLYHHLAI